MPSETTFERTQKLKEWIRSVTPEICPERARIATEVYKNTEGQPMALRRAKVLRAVLQRMSIWIHDGELIVGNQASTPRSSPFFPETTSTWVERELDSFWERSVDKFYVTPETRQILTDEVFPYWRDRTVEHLALNLMPEETKTAWLLPNPVFSPELYLRNGVGHLIAGYTTILENGFEGVIAECNQKLDQLDVVDPGSIEKRVFYESVIMSSKAAIAFALRFADLATALAAAESDPVRQQELEHIAEICRRVPAKPARTFWEAVQSFWFVQLLLQIEIDGLAISTERFDKLLFPYYARDVSAGLISKEQAQELLECLWIKTFEIMKVYDLHNATYFAGYSIGQIFTIGGVDAAGQDDTNELTYLCMEAEDNQRLSQPNLAVRINRNTPDRFLYRVCRHVAQGTGKPSLFNDETIIPSLLKSGVSLPEARDYGLIGCVEPGPPASLYGWTNAAMFNLAKCLELALNNGHCRLTGRLDGPQTGDPRAFTYDELVSAYKAQVEFFVKHMVSALSAIDLAHRQLVPLPLVSGTMRDCLERGLDLSAGGAKYNFMGPQGVGVADVADSLAAIKKLVYEEKAISMDELLHALDSDFAGSDGLRRRLQAAPKYGNDIDYVDKIAVDVGAHYCSNVEQYTTPRGGCYRGGLYPVSANVPMGQAVGALPSGRLAETPLADGVSPAPGADEKGPTAVLKSVAKLDHVAATNGTLLNQKFSPDALSTPEQIHKFMDLIRVYFELGGWHVQYNVVSAKTLRKAQEQPDDFKNLLVRVAGYSAFFVELDPSLQEAIIARTEHTAV
jgi:pyruvate formate-lyase/glycerol dehydratase family glycyl radical enzyme